MKVKRLKMTSFRGISDMTLDFQTEEPNVLIGINGVGKSSILDSISVLLSWLIAPIQFNPESRTTLIKQQGLVSSSERERDLAKGRYYKEQDIKIGNNQTYNEITLLLDSQEVNWSLTTAQEVRGIVTGINLSELESVTNDLRRQWQVSPEANLPLAVYYPVNRAVLDITLEIPKKNHFAQINAYEQAIAGTQIGFVNFFQWFRLLEDVENEERRDNLDYRDHQLEAVRQAISSLMPGFSNLRVRRSPLRMTATKQGQELIVNQLSDGEKGLMAMVGDLARRLAIANPGLPNPLQGEGVVLIDEIELHLHPKWQREIIPALTRTFPNCQFIVTTHSPQVISEVKPNGIYILEATSEGVVAKRPESSYGRDSNRILEDLMGVPARPQEFKDDLLELFRLIDKGDLDGARQLRQQIADEIGADEPELVKASVSIRRKEILSR
ncbi:MULTISPECIES: AAA family ATPase [Cyanophyceae]|uniref:AAA family ATPase n=1 Tax=Cyanophyceae TaxID=3028117 RepID=UPI0016898D51|nr:AAA family ATPase [Trichocoleus sp. FACHB-69]MBD1935554.1 AAA family ATPase [Trichocoleus sp. FACHB-69]